MKCSTHIFISLAWFFLFSGSLMTALKFFRYPLKPSSGLSYQYTSGWLQPPHQEKKNFFLSADSGQTKNPPWTFLGANWRKKLINFPAFFRRKLKNWPSTGDKKKSGIFFFFFSKGKPEREDEDGIVKLGQILLKRYDKRAAQIVSKLNLWSCHWFTLL